MTILIPQVAIVFVGIKRSLRMATNTHNPPSINSKSYNTSNDVTDKVIGGGLNKMDKPLTYTNDDGKKLYGFATYIIKALGGM